MLRTGFELRAVLLILRPAARAAAATYGERERRTEWNLTSKR
jgi:hypothetical protein